MQADDNRERSLERAAAELRRRVDPGIPVSLSEEDLARYSRDESAFRVTPTAVARPRNAAEISALIAAAAELGLPVTARAGGSSVAGQCLGSGLVIDTSTLDEIRIEGDTVVCGPGAVLDDVNAALRPVGRRIGPEATSSAVARIGGLIATNAAGARSLRYGRFGDAVAEVEAVTATGEAEALRRDDVAPPLRERLSRIRRGLDPLPKAWPRIHRTYGGYRLEAFARDGDALSLIPGSEGTLAVVTRARLLTVPLPGPEVTDVHPFDTLGAALDAAGELGAEAESVELLDAHIMRAAQRDARHVPLPAPESADSAVLVIDRSADAPPPRGGRRLSPDEAAALKRLRSGALALIGSGARVPIPLFEDPAVSPDLLPRFVAQMRSVLRDHGLDAVLYGHAAAGLVHVRPLVDPRDPFIRAELESALLAVADVVGGFGGALTGEHGFGLARSHLVDRVLGDEVSRAFEAIKRAFDPHSTLNPGRIVGGSDPFCCFSPARR